MKPNVPKTEYYSAFSTLLMICYGYEAIALSIRMHLLMVFIVVPQSSVHHKER